MRGILVIWTGLVIWSLVSLFFYRSSAIHGPDVVGEEVFYFALPLVLALVVSIVASFKQPLLQLPKWAVLALTFALAILEVAIYSVFVIG